MVSNNSDDHKCHKKEMKGILSWSAFPTIPIGTFFKSSATQRSCQTGITPKLGSLPNPTRNGHAASEPSFLAGVADSRPCGVKGKAGSVHRRRAGTYLRTQASSKSMFLKDSFFVLNWRLCFVSDCETCTSRAVCQGEGEERAHANGSLRERRKGEGGKGRGREWRRGNQNK